MTLSDKLNAGSKRPLDWQTGSVNDAEKALASMLKDAQKAGTSETGKLETKDTAAGYLPAITLSGKVVEQYVSAAPQGDTPPAKNGNGSDNKNEKGQKKAVVEPGERFQFQGQLIKFLATDSTKKIAIMEQATKPGGEPILIKETRESMAANYEAIPLGDRYVYVNKSGQVFESTGGYQLKELKGLFGIAPEKLPVDVRKPNWDEEDAFDDAQKKRLGDWKNVQATEKIDGQKITVEADSNGARRIYTVGENQYLLAGRGLWYKHLNMEGPHGPITSHGDLKLHVTIGGTERQTAAEDLKRLQAAVIPALEEAVRPGGKLYGKVHGYKTFDPMFGFDKNWSDKEPFNRQLPLGSRIEPGSTGQDAKGFTIYPASDEHAREVADFCAKVIKENKLTFEAPRKTGNVSDKFVDSETNRISLEKDMFEGAVVKTAIKQCGAAVLDDKLEKALRDYAERKVKEGAPDWGRFKKDGVYEGDPKLGRLSPDALSQILADAKIDRWECGITYTKSKDGKSKLAFYSGEVQLNNDGKYYLEEAKANKEVVYERSRIKEGLTGRPAYYELSKVVGDFTQQDLNPARLQLDTIERTRHLQNASFEKSLLSEEVVEKFHERMQAIAEELSERPADAGNRLRNNLVDFMSRQGVENPQLTNAKTEIVFEAGLKQAHIEHIVNGAVTDLRFDGKEFQTKDGKKVPPDTVSTRITLPEELLKGSSAELTRKVYAAWLGQSASSQAKDNLIQAVDGQVENTLAKLKESEPRAKPREADLSGLNIAELPKAGRAPEALIIGESGVHAPGTGEHISFADIWKAKVEKLKEQLEAEKKKSGSERNESAIAEAEKRYKAEVDAYRALSNPEHPQHATHLALAQKELSEFRLKQAELEAAREGGEHGARGRLVIITAIAASLLSRSGH